VRLEGEIKDEDPSLPAIAHRRGGVVQGRWGWKERGVLQGPQSSHLMQQMLSFGLSSSFCSSSTPLGTGARGRDLHV